MAAAEELVSTPAERAALEHLRTATGTVDSPMERHSVRCRHIAARVAADRGWVLDGEVLTVAALLHDIGLYAPYASDGVYTADGAQLARRMLPPFGWIEQRMQICADAVERHHELRRQLDWGAEVEALRLADLIDVSGGRIRFRVDRGWLQQLFASIPRRGLGRELAREVGRALRRRPGSVPRIFLRPGAAPGGQSNPVSRKPGR